MNYYTGEPPMHSMVRAEKQPDSIEKLLGMPEHVSEDVLDQPDNISLDELARIERR